MQCVSSRSCSCSYSDGYVAMQALIYRYSYLSLILRLRLLYANKTYAAKICYPETRYSRPWAAGVRDVWEGNAIREYKESGICYCLSITYCRQATSTTHTQLLLHFSTNGVQLFRN